MYCPDCGKDNSNGQRFCRACGLSLQAISQVLVDARSASKSDNDVVRSIQPKQGAWHNPLLYGFFMLVLGLIIIAIGKTVLGEQLIADIGTMISVIGVGLISFKGISLLRSPSSSLPATKALPEIRSTTELPSASQFEGLPAVTEDTTRHLEPIQRERKEGLRN